ncbi:MAG TPA: ABC transporter ATP-binding protein [Candidatus Hydrogenedentes bacterium]|nr:ABC transporter ATP-binding protein [Candidatus Hydrogenedentota bacterium]
MNTKDNHTIIEVRDLVTHYGETQILDHVSLAVPRGTVYVIIGGSGCGKTTLLKHMCGLLKPSSGQILYQGEDIVPMEEDDLAKMQRSIGIAFQTSGLLNSMTVGDNVALPLREYGNMDEPLIQAVVRMKLGLVGLADMAHLMPDELSGGMRKRAGLARAIALDPPLVYFDEPSAGLDPIMACGLDELILDLRRMLGITFVIVTHELDSIRKIADRILMLDRGTVIFDGTMEDVERTETERVRQFFERRPDEYIVQRTI